MLARQVRAFLFEDRHSSTRCRERRKSPLKAGCGHQGAEVAIQGELGHGRPFMGLRRLLRQEESPRLPGPGLLLLMGP
jgi:hypothetical protein